MRISPAHERRSPRRATLALLCLAATLLVPAVAMAQDVEAAARNAGRQLPQGYYDRIRENPDFFEIRRGWIATADRAAQKSTAVAGHLPLVVVQALFSDSPEPTISTAEIQRTLFDGPAPYGTLAEYYSEVSGGRLRVTGRVLPWVRTSITRAEARGSSFGLGGDAQLGTFLVDALREADGTVDFAQFDNDGPDGVPNSGDDDGYVDAVAFQFIERDAACGGEGVWPHRARIGNWPSVGAPYRTDDLRPNGEPILINDYIIQSTVDCGGAAPLTASIIAHELGHVLGLPDLYDSSGGIQPAQRRWVLGCWTLMAAGAWGCGDGATFHSAKRPPHMGPWEKSILGWIDEQIVGGVRDQEFILAPVQTSGRSLRIPLSASEYLQVEYRPRQGFDTDLPAGGVLIYHVDTFRPLRPCPTCERVYHIALEEADGDSALVRTAQEGGNRGVAGDVWGIGGRVSFSNLTTPSTRLNSGTPSSVTFHSIVVENGVAKLRLSTAAAPALVAGGQLPGAVALAEYRAELWAAGGALPYQWTVAGTIPRGLSGSVDGDRFVLTGTPLESGSFPLPLQLLDVRGTRVTQDVVLRIEAPAAFALERLLQPFTRSSATPLTAQEQIYLDQAGNRNGRYDVGDLRKYLKANP
jgi:M6 family metalloprotease-like protein